MAKGITYSCANIWRSVARPGGWWSVMRLAREWDGVFSLDEIAEHLVTLRRGNFLESMEYRREGTVYAFTSKCRPLPGAAITPVTSPPGESAAADGVTRTPLHGDAMTAPDAPPPYAPPRDNYRPGALDHLKCPSLLMGQRRVHQGGAQ